MPRSSNTSASHSNVVIVGSSVASVRLIEALRREAWAGSITVVTADAVPFYNRPPLSKEYLVEDQTVDDILLIDSATRSKLGVDVMASTTASGLDIKGRTLLTDRGDVRFDTLVIASGARARRLPVFDGFSNVYYLRNLEDADRLRTALKQARTAVVIGFGFIGCEVTSSLLELGVDVTIVDASLKPYSHFGRYFSDALTSIHRNEGAKLILGSTVDRVHGGDRIDAVELDSGEHLRADLYIVAVGAIPNTEWVEGSGLAVDDGVVCDATLLAGPNVFAIGDVARWPHPLSGAMTRVEHWTNAVDQAATVAYNITHPANRRTHAAVPYFWSTQFGRSVQYLGFLDNFSQEAWFRSPRGGLAAVLGKEDRIRGIIGIDAATILMRSRNLITEGAPWSIGLDEITTLAQKYHFERI